MPALLHSFLVYCWKQGLRFKWHLICLNIAVMHWSGEQMWCHITGLVPSCCCSIQLFSIFPAFSQPIAKSNLTPQEELKRTETCLSPLLFQISHFNKPLSHRGTFITNSDSLGMLFPPSVPTCCLLTLQDWFDVNTSTTKSFEKLMKIRQREEQRKQRKKHPLTRGKKKRTGSLAAKKLSNAGAEKMRRSKRGRPQQVDNESESSEEGEPQVAQRAKFPKSSHKRGRK